jgi:hypothetical protein
MLPLLLAGCGAPPPPATKKTELKPDPVKITQFWVTDHSIAAGETIQLCYGVENAAKVTLDPPVARVYPAISRCFEITPQQTTTFTFTAEDTAGRQTQAKATVQVGAARPAGPAPVRISDVMVSALQVSPGYPVSICVKGKNAVSWTIEPGQWQKPATSEGGCVVDTPRQTTTYRITAHGAGGTADRESVTIRVP